MAEGPGGVGPEEVGGGTAPLLLEGGEDLGVGAVADLDPDTGLRLKLLDQGFHQTLSPPRVDGERGALGEGA